MTMVSGCGGGFDGGGVDRDAGHEATVWVSPDGPTKDAASEVDAVVTEASTPPPDAVGAQVDEAGKSGGHVDAGSDATDAPCVPTHQCDNENCGDKDDGCGGHWHCGDCTDAAPSCGSITPHVCGPCIPATCHSLGYFVACGAAPDGCGGVLSCPDCNAPATCGGGGVPFRCGHT